MYAAPALQVMRDAVADLLAAMSCPVAGLAAPLLRDLALALLPWEPVSIVVMFNIPFSFPSLLSHLFPIGKSINCPLLLAQLCLVAASADSFRERRHGRSGARTSPARTVSPRRLAPPSPLAPLHLRFLPRHFSASAPILFLQRRPLQGGILCHSWPCGAPPRRHGGVLVRQYLNKLSIFFLPHFNVIFYSFRRCLSGCCGSCCCWAALWCSLCCRRGPPLALASSPDAADLEAAASSSGSPTPPPATPLHPLGTIVCVHAASSR